MSDVDMEKIAKEQGRITVRFDEYARLLARVDELSAALTDKSDALFVRQAENARLRAALENLLTFDAVDENEDLRSIIRTALELGAADDEDDDEEAECGWLCGECGQTNHWHLPACSQAWGGLRRL